MTISPLTTLPLTASKLPGVLASTSSPLSDTYQTITQSTGYAQRRADAEEAAAGLVSNALILPILKQVRRSSFSTQGPFSPGTGEKAFGPEFDIQIADRVAHSPRLGIKEALADRLMKKSSPAAANATLDVHG